MTKASATEDLFDRSTTLISSAFASLSIDTILSANGMFFLIFTS